MKADIVSEKENPLRKRKEYWLMVEHDGKQTPSRQELLPQVAKKLGTKEDITVLDKIFSERGTAKSRVKVQVYSDRKEVPKEKLDKQARKVKKFLEKKQAAEAAPEKKEEAEQKTEEAAPAEEHEEEKEEPATEEPGEEEPAEEPEAAEAEEPEEEKPPEETENAEEQPSEEASSKVSDKKGKEE